MSAIRNSYFDEDTRIIIPAERETENLEGNFGKKVALGMETIYLNKFFLSAQLGWNDFKAKSLITHDYYYHTNFFVDNVSFQVRFGYVLK